MIIISGNRFVHFGKIADISIEPLSHHRPRHSIPRPLGTRFLLSSRQNLTGRSGLVPKSACANAVSFTGANDYPLDQASAREVCEIFHDFGIINTSNKVAYCFLIKQQGLIRTFFNRISYPSISHTIRYKLSLQILRTRSGLNPLAVFTERGTPHFFHLLLR
jgi:hypothetical protein